MPLLFSYGTLQLPRVQKELFGRLLEGQPDVLEGYKKEPLTLIDPTVVRLSNSKSHVILVETGNGDDRVEGWIYEVSEKELQRADSYEPNEYRRRLTTFLSGSQAWVYTK